MAAVITQRDIIRFTCGDCHILARRLHKQTGWTLATFGTPEGLPIDHAFVIHPSGDAVDVQGRRSMEDFKSDWRWTGSSGIVLTWDSWPTLATHDGETGDWSTPDDTYSYLRAAQLVPVLVEAAG